jgi:hypothetical protein
MRSDRPVLAAAVFLAAGLSVLFCNGRSGSGLDAALPISNSNFHLRLAAAGPAAIGGVILVTVGVLCFIWAIVAALGWHWRLLTGQERARQKLAASRAENPPDFQRDKSQASSSGQGRYM